VELGNKTAIIIISHLADLRIFFAFFSPRPIYAEEDE
jgi:hypothetical protein